MAGVRLQVAYEPEIQGLQDVSLVMSTDKRQSYGEAKRDAPRRRTSPESLSP
jgi:hypothetical protein